MIRERPFLYDDSYLLTLSIPRTNSAGSRLKRSAIDRCWNGGYELLITTDQNLKYQQNLGERKIAVVVLLSTSWPRIREHVDTILRTIESSAAGSYEEVSIP